MVSDPNIQTKLYPTLSLSLSLGMCMWVPIFSVKLGLHFNPTSSSSSSLSCQIQESACCVKPYSVLVLGTVFEPSHKLSVSICPFGLFKTLIQAASSRLILHFLWISSSFFLVRWPCCCHIIQTQMHALRAILHSNES